MATSGSSSATVTSYDTLKISWTLNSQSTSKNTSNITFKAQLVSSSAGKISSTASKSYTATVNGTSYSGTNTVGISNNSTLTLWSKTLTLTHNSDGSLSFTFSFSQTFDITFSGSKVGTISCSCTVTPTTIARASSITSASNVTLGNACSVKWTPASSSFAYKLKFVCGSVSHTTGYISPGTTSAYTYTGYTMALSTWAPAITTAMSGTCTVTLYTYSSSSSSSSIGSSSSSFTITISSSDAKPTASISSTAEANSAVTIGAYTQDMSKVKVTFTGTSKYSAALKTYSLKIGSSSYSGSISSGSSISVTSGTLSTTGTISISLTVTDARGQTSSTASTSITVYAYSTPSLTTFKATRVDTSGNEDTNGTKIKLEWAYSVSSVNSKNTASMTIKHKESTASSYSTTDTSSTSLSQSTSSTLTATFDTEKGYDFQITVTDAFTTVTKISSVSTSLYPLSIYYNGTGVAIGKAAETGNLFDIGWKTKISSGSYQLTLYNNTGSGDTYMNVKSWSGEKVNFGIGSGGNNRGIYDGTSANAWSIYSNSSKNVYLANSTNWNACYISNTSTSTYIRGSRISVSGDLNTNLYVGSTSDTSARRVYVRNSYGSVYLGVSTASNKGVYTNTGDNWLIYSNSSNETRLGAPEGTWKPYWSKGDSFSNSFYGTGFITSSRTNLEFNLPLTMPIVGSPTISMSGNIAVRQNGNYLYGSSSSSYASVTNSMCSITATYFGLRVLITFSGDSNATNNSACGITLNSWTVTFS